MKNKPLIFYLAALSAFPSFSTDTYLAAMPIIQRLFATTEAKMQLTLSLFFVTFAIMLLIWGPMSDRLGRKTVTFIGLSVYIVGSVLSALSHQIGLLIFARMIQAAGACCGTVMSIAIIKDYFKDHIMMTRVLSLALSIMIIAPVVAPVVGGYLLKWFGWESIFYFLAIYGVVLFIATIFTNESHHHSLRKPLSPSQLAKAYQQQILYTPFLLAVLGLATNFGVLFAFVASSPFIYIALYHIQPHQFGYYFALNALGIIVGNWIGRRLTGRVHSKLIVFIPLIASILLSLLMMILIGMMSQSIWCIVIPMFFITLTFGLIFPELNSLALQHVIEFNGLASSLLGSCRFILASITGFIMGFLTTQSALPLPLVMMAFGLVTVAVMLSYFRKCS